MDRILLMGNRHQAPTVLVADIVKVANLICNGDLTNRDFMVGSSFLLLFALRSRYSDAMYKTRLLDEDALFSSQ